MLNFSLLLPLVLHCLLICIYRRSIPFVINGGLASIGFDPVEQHREAASYVDRILKSEKAGGLPMQAPTKYEMVINLKNREGARPHSASLVARPRRRGDRVTPKHHPALR
jgi:hypothetical protein